MQKRSITRVFHHYEKWEEYRWGMWRIVTGEEREPYFHSVRRILESPYLFRCSLYSAWTRWPISCEVNLTNRSMNRAAWLWHAGACVVTGAPEDITRSAWPSITQEQRVEADRIAWEVVEEWEEGYLESHATNLHMPTQRLPNQDQASLEVLQEA